MDISVIKVDPVTRRVSFGISPVTISGASKLLQIVVLSLLNVPGKDVLDPALGGGLPEMIGMNIDPDDTSEVLAEVVRRVKKTQAEVISSQIGLNIPDEEKLRELHIVNVGPGETIDEVLVTLRIVNEAGRITDVVF